MIFLAFFTIMMKKICCLCALIDILWKEASVWGNGEGNCNFGWLFTLVTGEECCWEKENFNVKLIIPIYLSTIPGQGKLNK